MRVASIATAASAAAASCDHAAFGNCVNEWRTANPSCSKRDDFITIASSAGGAGMCGELATALTPPRGAACFATSTQMCSSSVSFCDGNHVVWCSGRVGQTGIDEDCSLRNLSCEEGDCRDGGGACTHPLLSSYNWPECIAGRYLAWCPSTVGSPHYVDCRALGFEGCDGTIQRPGMPNVPAKCR